MGCSIAGCLKPGRYKVGLCPMHYERKRVGRIPMDAPPGTRLRKPLAELVEIDPETQCWNWTGHVGANGYGYRGGPLAHRESYELHVGPIPDGLQIDHLCRNRRCVNPEHLEAVTPRENYLRSSAQSAITHRTNTCFRGHLLTPDNTQWDSRGQRRCRTCLMMLRAGTCDECGREYRNLGQHQRRMHPHLFAEVAS